MWFSLNRLIYLLFFHIFTLSVFCLQSCLEFKNVDACISLHPFVGKTKRKQNAKEGGALPDCFYFNFADRFQWGSLRLPALHSMNDLRSLNRFHVEVSRYRARNTQHGRQVPTRSCVDVLKSCREALETFCSFAGVLKGGELADFLQTLLQLCRGGNLPPVLQTVEAPDCSSPPSAREKLMYRPRAGGRCGL